MTQRLTIYNSASTPFPPPPSGTATPTTELTAFFDSEGPPPNAAQQAFGGFTPQGAVVSTTPQGFSAFFDVHYTLPLNAAWQPFGGFHPQGKVVSITPQGFSAFFDAGRKPASAAQYPWDAFTAQGTIKVSSPTLGFSSFFDAHVTLPLDAALQPSWGWPTQNVPPPTPVPNRDFQAFFDVGRAPPPTFYFPFWGFTPQLIGGSVPPPFPPTPIPGPFPPNAPTGLTKIIPAYLYQQYNDDDDLQAFFASYNSYGQSYVDWFNQIQLPVYTNPLIQGALLDWVAQGLYGVSRPELSSGHNRYLGPFNTYDFDTLGFNAQKRVGPSDIVATSDDIYKRCITWAFYKGDGKIFNIRWLKRRVMRFLLGVNGTSPNIDNTDQVSVVFGLGNQVSIVLVTGKRTVTGGALFNRFNINAMPFNQLNTTFTSISPLPDAAIFQEAVKAGVLELPFQFQWSVVI